MIDVFDQMDPKEMANAAFEVTQMLALALVAKGHFKPAELAGIFSVMEKRALAEGKKESTAFFQSITELVAQSDSQNLLPMLRAAMHRGPQRQDDPPRKN
jgi:hypothetical protein